MGNFDELKELLEKSFLPLTCDVSKFDYNEFLKFRIKDNSNNILYEIHKISSDIYKKPAKLNSLIFEVRQNLISKGFILLD